MEIFCGRGNLRTSAEAEPVKTSYRPFGPMSQSGELQPFVPWLIFEPCALM